MSDAERPHIPVLLRPLLEAVAPVSGVWLDGTFGAGGYTRGLLAAGAGRVIGVDRDPSVFAMAEGWRGDYGDRLVLVEGTFSELDTYAAEIAPGEGGFGGLDGVVLDLGVSSMQLDQAERGFSFRFDGPLDMRMGSEGVSAADLVNGADEERLADIFYHYGEERASRRIARAIVSDRKAAPFTSTKQLAEMIARVNPAKPTEIHPATRAFQGLRIAVNDELGELARALAAAERILKPGGRLVVVTFHSLEDRIVKQFFAERSGRGKARTRLLPGEPIPPASTFDCPHGQPIAPGAAELAANPRSRSAKLRYGVRTDAPARGVTEELRRLTALPERKAKRS